MTPLAMRLAKELTLPKRERTVTDKLGILPRITEAHCFEMTAAIPLFEEIQGMRRSSDYSLDGTLETTMFLPAPVTWMEWLVPGPHQIRQAWMMTETADEIDVVCAIGSKIQSPFIFPLGVARKTGKRVGIAEQWRDFLPDEQRGIKLNLWDELGAIPVSLAIVNSPRLIGRRQHMPHAGLERRLAAAKGLTGKFPLQAWTEIKLEITPPRIDDEGPHEAHLTGDRALHFCRAHLRVRFGRLEYVSAHWRGDASLGIKRSRYVMVPSAA